MTRTLHAAKIVAVAIALLAISPAQPAYAHVGLDRMEPAAGSVTEADVTEVALHFSADITSDRLTIDVYTRDGRSIPFTGEGITRGKNVARGALPALEYGTYVVVWSAIGTDGHFAAGQEHFSYGFEEAGAIADFQARMSASIPEIATRWAVYALMAFLVGVVWLSRVGLVFQPEVARSFAVRIGGAVAALTLLRLSLVGQRVGGEEGIAHGVTRILTSWPAGGGWALMLAAVAMLAARQSGTLAAAALVAFAWGDGLAGHLGSDLQSQMLVPLISLHLLGAGLWLGGPAAYLVLGDKERSREFAKRFGGWAAGAFAVVAASGVGLAQIRTGALTAGAGQLAGYPYGIVLLLKTAAVAVVVIPLGGYQALSTLKDKIAQMRSAHEGRKHEEHDTGKGFRRYILLAEAGALATVLAAGVLMGSMSATPPRAAPLSGSSDLLAAPASFDECMGGSDVSQLVCANNWFTGLARTQGFTASLEDLTKRWNEGDSWIQLNCHSIAHTIGRAAYSRYGNAQEAFRQGSDPCDYGYLHGVIEGASAAYTDDELKEGFLDLCEGLGDVSQHTYRQCVHGLGHAAARRTNNELPRAVDFCRAFWREGVDTSRIALEGVTDELSAAAYLLDLCVTGVSMEWNTTTKARESTALPIGSPGTLMYECLQLETEFQSGCIEYATSNLGGGTDGYEVHLQLREWCDENLKDPFPCYLSIGRGIIWSEGVDYEQAVDICTGGSGGENEIACITWALGSVATISLDADSIDEFCPYIPERLHYLCDWVQRNMRIQIEQTVRGFILE